MPTFIKAGYWEKLQKGYKSWLNLDELISSVPLPTKSYATELKFDSNKEIYYDATGENLTFTLSTSGNVNGNIIILRLNKPTSATFPSNFEASSSSSELDATKLNVYALLYFSNWDGLGNSKIIYSNSLYTAL